MHVVLRREQRDARAASAASAHPCYCAPMPPDMSSTSPRCHVASTDLAPPPKTPHSSTAVTLARFFVDKRSVARVMMHQTQPRVPLPPPLTSDVPGTWAFDTMSRRVRTDILARIFRENQFQSHVVLRLQQLDTELSAAATTPLSLLPHDGGPDITVWNEHILKSFVQQRCTWLSAPWAVAEFYL